MLTYGQVHYLLQKKRGNAKDFPCSSCGGPAYEWAFQGGGDGRSYSENLAEYDPMCRPCHQKLDRDRRWGNPEYRQRRSEASKKLWENPEHRDLMKATGAKVSSRRRSCSTCGLVSHPGGIGRHQQVSGHQGWEEVGEIDAGT